MRNIIVCLLMLCSYNAFTAPKHQDCNKYWLPIFRPLCERLHRSWEEGKTDLYISGYAWHNRFTYSREWLHTKKYNELAWGGGLGKSMFDERGNWHGIYAFAFLDSHKNVEPVIGYARLFVTLFTSNIKAGVGYSFLITARPDIMHNIPFPGAVPWAGIFINNISLKAAYIPGSSSNGNVLYMVGTYTFDT
ncbi:MAG: lipid IV(A) palmitoyltransferase PagP [Legionella sp.]|uniref:lipid IV(A) palmitoyltransferase PagP n=1 Tax=Legionella sp. TaxID=459 RepID=UPI0039E5F128